MVNSSQLKTVIFCPYRAILLDYIQPNALHRVKHIKGFQPLLEEKRFFLEKGNIYKTQWQRLWIRK